MIWSFIFIGCILAIDVTVVVHAWGWWRNEQGFDFWFVLVMPFILGGLINVLALGGGYGLGYLIGTFIGRHSDQVWQQYWHANLASLRNSDGIKGEIHGGAFLLSGRIGSEEVYYYYTNEGDSHYKPHKWFADSNTTVIEEDRTDAEVYQYDAHFKAGEWLNLFAIARTDIRMDFHIPKGSLVQQYSLK